MWHEKLKLPKVQAAIIGLVAFLYYLILSAKDWTWVFVSQDSGDWLTAANMWLVPQPYGSPLYIVLCRLFGLLPGNQAFNLTLLLSVVPAAITVAVVYLVVVRLTGRRLVAMVASGVLLASAVFLTQSTVLEEYVIATMFLTLAMYFRLHTRPYLCALSLACGSAIHVIVLLAGVIWVVADFKFWASKLRPLLLSGVVAGGSYILILVLMYLDTPRMFAGGLNLKSLTDYLSATGGGVTGQLSIYEFPQRLWDALRIFAASLGLALIPMIYALRHPIKHLRLGLFATIFIMVGFYITCLDYGSWTFLTFAMPSFAILTGVGLSKLQPYHTNLVIASCVALLGLNSVFLNANTLTNDKPIAREYYEELQLLPPSSIVVTHAGAYSMGTFYAMSKGVDVIPLVFPYLDWWEFEDYRLWLKAKYDVYIPPQTGTVQAVKYLLEDGQDVYFAYYPNRASEIQDALVLEGAGALRKVVSVHD